VTIIAIDHVQVAAPPDCEAATRAFYSGVLGLPELPKPEPLASRGGCWFRAGPLELHVGVEDPFAPARKAHPGFVVDDLAALRARLAAAGIAVRDETDLPGAVRFYADDPFGNRLEFRQA
jgi:catechol 2,3-dioxygenase-like lactoylglutathione lyase family enzyme